MVGFQTKLKHAEQTRVFRMIPGLARAEFARLGGLHRNTFLNSPKLLDGLLRLKAMPRLRFAGQITGCEGYVESAAIGLLAGRFAAAERLGEAPRVPPPTTAHGALIEHITGGHVETIDAGPRSFQPMNVNFGLFPPLTKSPGRGPDGERLRGTAKAMARRSALTTRALADLGTWPSPASSFPPPPCGEGSGVGVGEFGTLGSQPHDPPPRPSPARGEGETVAPLVPASDDAGVPEPHPR
jgi:methylenetetrahydrofolate--tRNA-(uracil-5-)-methyltransferase